MLSYKSRGPQVIKVKTWPLFSLGPRIVEVTGDLKKEKRNGLTLRPVGFLSVVM